MNLTLTCLKKPFSSKEKKKPKIIFEHYMDNLQMTSESFAKFCYKFFKEYADMRNIQKGSIEMELKRVFYDFQKGIEIVEDREWDSYAKKKIHDVEENDQYNVNLQMILSKKGRYQIESIEIEACLV